MEDDLGWLTKIREELVARRDDYPSCSGAFSAVDNAINRLQDELRDMRKLLPAFPSASPTFKPALLTSGRATRRTLSAVRLG